MGRMGRMGRMGEEDRVATGRWETKQSAQLNRMKRDFSSPPFHKCPILRPALEGGREGSVAPPSASSHLCLSLVNRS